MTRSLRPGGRFAWNAFAFDHELATQLDGDRQSRPVPHVNHHDVAENRIDMMLDDGATSSLWWATKNEWLGLIDVAGLQLETLTPDERAATIRAGFVNDPTNVPTDLIDRAQRKADVRIAATEGRQARQ